MNTLKHILVLMAALWSGCVEINGGAVELNWTLRGFNGENIGDQTERCEMPGVKDVRIVWVHQEGLGTGFSQFPCVDGQGTTPFEIPDGQVAFSTQPVCCDGTPGPAGSYQAPAPIVRAVTLGQVVSLRTLLIEVEPQAGPQATCPAISSCL